MAMCNSSSRRQQITSYKLCIYFGQWWETLGLGIHVDVTLSCTTISRGHIYPLMLMVFPDGSAKLQKLFRI